jgi:hypothetical protein
MKTIDNKIENNIKNSIKEKIEETILEKVEEVMVEKIEVGGEAMKGDKNMKVDSKKV